MVQPSCPPVSDGIIELLMTIDALAHASAGRITAVMPYFPYVRSDKKDRPRISITARLMADLLETAGAEPRPHDGPALAAGAGLLPHPGRAPAGRRHPVRLPAPEPRPREHVLVAGDVGESKDVGQYAKRLDLPIAIVDKRRDGDDENARATNLIGDVAAEGRAHRRRRGRQRRHRARGGELRAGAGRRRGEACVVHAVLSGRAIERIEASPIRQLVVTVSIPLPPREAHRASSTCSRWRASSRRRSAPSTTARACRTCSASTPGGREQEGTPRSVVGRLPAAPRHRHSRRRERLGRPGRPASRRPRRRGAATGGA